MSPAIETAAVWAAEHEHRVGDSAAFPIFQSATYSYRGEKRYDDVRYLRCNNCPNQVVLSAKLAELEGTETAMVTSSGMAAISSTLLTFLSSGDHVIATKALYGGTMTFMKKDLPKMGVTVTKVDPDDPDAWQAALTSTTKVFYTEALSNPLVELADLEAIAKFAKANNLISMIDSTFATPVLFRPVMDLGFDIVLHSATKYLNGHSDIVAGVLAGRRELVDQVVSKLNHLGGCLDPHTCFLLQRGIKTLALRVNQHCKNAMALCEFLEGRPEVKKVYYPALKSSPFYKRTAKLLGGRAGGVFSFELVAGTEAADAFVEALEFAMCAPSLGGVESLITRPATTSHADLSDKELQDAGISKGLIRVAIGIENTEDLIADFKKALVIASGGADHSKAANGHSQ